LHAAGGVFVTSILDVAEKGIDALYRANLKHVILCTQRVGRVMVAAGRGGSVINVASIEQTLHVDGGTSAAAGWYHHPETGDYASAHPDRRLTPRAAGR
jgi:NAD(P)-dependent dehydrogenase (short-subunit alcohol dehydrogenase family)